MQKVFKSIGLIFLAVSFVFLGIGQTSVYAKSKQNKNVERAEASYTALKKYFYQPQSKLFHETYPNKGNPYSYAWSFSQAFEATDAMLSLPHVGYQYLSDANNRIEGLEAYLDNHSTPAGFDSYVLPPLGQGGDKFYDDNAVVGLALVHYYNLVQRLEAKKPASQKKDVISNEKTKKALKLAEKAFAFDVSGWDNDPTHPFPGGLYWVQASWTHIRATNATSIAAELGLRLYQITGNPYYFNWSKKMYDWVNASMLAPNGLYWNSVDLNGNFDKTFWSYSQGAMIGSSVIFYQITKDKVYLKRAESIANSALSYWNTDIPLYQQPPIFNSRFFINLLQLEAVDHNPKYRQDMQKYADYVWNHNRNLKTGLFFGSDSQGLLKQSAMVKIYGALASQSPKQNQ